MTLFLEVARVEQIAKLRWRLTSKQAKPMHRRNYSDLGFKDSLKAGTSRGGANRFTKKAINADAGKAEAGVLFFLSVVS